MEQSYGFPSNYFQNKHPLWPAVTKSKGKQKSPEFDTKYDPVVRKSKGMQKSPELTQHMTL
jgi:hypothetical protein